MLPSYNRNEYDGPYASRSRGGANRGDLGRNPATLDRRQRRQRQLSRSDDGDLRLANKIEENKRMIFENCQQISALQKEVESLRDQVSLTRDNDNSRPRNSDETMGIGSQPVCPNTTPSVPKVLTVKGSGQVLQDWVEETNKFISKLSYTHEDRSCGLSGEPVAPSDMVVLAESKFDELNRKISRLCDWAETMTPELMEDYAYAGAKRAFLDAEVLKQIGERIGAVVEKKLTLLENKIEPMHELIWDVREKLRQDTAELQHLATTVMTRMSTGASNGLITKAGQPGLKMEAAPEW